MHSNSFRRRSIHGAAAALLAATLLPTLALAQTLISTSDGNVQGQTNELTREFLGIPYAAPPVGSLRFAPPAPAVPWGATLDATNYPPGCAQLPTLANNNVRTENEDCLYLNVWAPDPAPITPLPVMIWIHGGSNTSGSTSDFVPFPGFEGMRLYDGHRLAQNGNVIVVTVNYRLNVFGFLGLTELAAEDPAWPYAGNQGLLDQRAAMLWVQDNIAAFGGDPNNVTIFGESAGSFDVCAHVVSPMSRGLFHRAISESGGCTVGVQSTEESTQAADILAEAVGCDTAPDRLACMRAAPLGDILDAGPLVALVGEGSNLALSVDGGFLEEQPMVTLDRGDLPRLPYLMGANSDEGTLFFIGAPEITAPEYSAELLSRFGVYAAQIEALYPATRFGTPLDTLIRVVGDGTLVCSTFDVAKRYSRMRNRTFAYNFARVPPIPFISLLDLGAFHALEVAYVFGSAGNPSGADEILSDQMQKYWSSFAAKARPKATGTRSWPRFNPRGYSTMTLKYPLGRSNDFRKAECDMWSELYETGDF